MNTRQLWNALDIALITSSVLLAVALWAWIGRTLWLFLGWML